jgi:hypothetical protein
MLESMVWMTISRVLGVVSALVLHVLIWTVLALFTTLGLAVADAGEATFYATWAFFAAVIVAGTVLTVRWGRQGRRWLWRITVSWTLLFVLAATTLLVALIPLGLLCLHPRVRVWVASCLVPPRPRPAY